jgi:hypothetical protein
LNYHYKGRGANDWEYVVSAYKPSQPSHKIPYGHFEKAFLAYLGDLDWRAMSNEAEPAELKVLTGRLNGVRSELDRTGRTVARNQKLIESAKEVPLSLFSAQDKAQARLIELQAERSRLEAEEERIKSRSSVIDHPERVTGRNSVPRRIQRYSSSPSRRDTHTGQPNRCWLRCADYCHHRGANSQHSARFSECGNQDSVYKWPHPHSNIPG